MLFFKAIELQGFKTFANKTRVDLLPGITVIVGPNGCGKSNVFDAIRWALGEQSAKSMRGSRMGDVIFNGSSSLKGTGMAKVNLILNNAQRSLPIDYDEVSISRRLYRSGESEYALNKNLCRLKDITALLMDTGIGTDSYSIMEQGKVDEIITSKPLERRALFDEAAGISKYKAKKDEALHKLARTDDDLLRLADVLVEVKRQAGSLKRQASKAEKYKQLSSQLKRLEMELLVRRFFAFKHSTAESEAHYQELVALVATLRQELERVDNDQVTTRETAGEVQRVLEENQSFQFSLTSEIHECTGKIALLDQRLATFDEQRATFATQIEEYRQQQEQIDRDTAQMQVEIADRTATQESLRNDYSDKKAAYDAIKGEFDQTASEMARLRQEVSAATRQRMEQESRAQLARVMEEKISDELDRSDAELRLVNEQIEELSIQRDELHTSADENEQILAALQADLESTRGKLAAAEAELTQTARELDKVGREAQDSKSRHDALAELQENYEGYFRGVKEVMRASQRGELQGLRGVVSTIIEAKKEHELAIESALGGQAQDIIVERAEDAKAAIGWLKRNQLGRATFLPLDLLEPKDTPHEVRQAAREPGVVGLAMELVKFDESIRKAAQYLLGNVIVCENLDVAIGLERRGIRTRFVTLDGDMVTPHGAMSGGSVKSLGLLHRTREVKELATRMQELRRREEVLRKAADERRQIFNTLRETREKLSSSLNSHTIETARARKDFEMADQKLTEKTSHRNRLQSRRAEMDQDLGRQRELQQQGGSNVEQLQELCARLEGELAALESRATERQQEVADMADELGNLMVSISTGDERLANMRDKVASADRDKVRLASMQTDKQKEIELLKERKEAAQAEIEALKLRLGELHERVKSVDELITHENARRETITLDLRRLGERAQVLQRDLNEAQNNLHEVELKRTEQLLQIDNINVQASEKFGLTLDDVIRQVFEAVLQDEIAAAAPPAEGEAAPETPSQIEITAPETAEAALAKLRPTEEIAGRLSEIRASIESLGPVHVGAIDEYNELQQRFEFLTTQEADLVLAQRRSSPKPFRDRRDVERDISAGVFRDIRDNFEQVFRRLFGGGRADLILTEENGVLESGIDIVAQPPGKKPQHISLLSGGEKALTAISLLFAIFMRKPSPFCILDEIDAPLDDKNIERFKDLVREFASITQFIIITHNKQTMALANTIYGVTMEEQGVSRVVSLKLDEVDEAELLETAEATA
jgi:chromosome segregation protein